MRSDSLDHSGEVWQHIRKAYGTPRNKSTLQSTRFQHIFQDCSFALFALLAAFIFGCFYVLFAFLFSLLFVFIGKKTDPKMFSPKCLGPETLGLMPFPRAVLGISPKFSIIVGQRGDPPSHGLCNLGLMPETARGKGISPKFSGPKNSGLKILGSVFFPMMFVLFAFFMVSVYHCCFTVLKCIGRPVKMSGCFPFIFIHIG